MKSSEILAREKPKFTSGTWHASRNFRVVGDSPGIDVGASNGTNVATVHFSHLDQEAPEVSANARLIAAAPELYEALSSLLNCVDGVHEYDQLHRCKRNALAALAKAEVPNDHLR